MSVSIMYFNVITFIVMINNALLKYIEVFYIFCSRKQFRIYSLDQRCAVIVYQYAIVMFELVPRLIQIAHISS